MEYPLVWVVIPTWNRLSDLRNCLFSLEQNDYPNKQIVVVDNHSEDGTARYLKTYQSTIHLIELDKNYGAAKASNCGFQYALKNGADYVLRLDSDTALSQDFITKLIKAGQNKPLAGVLVGKILYFDDPERIWSLGAYLKKWNLGASEIARGQLNASTKYPHQEVDLAWSTGMLIRRKLLEQTNGFDEAYFVYFEEADFCLQAKMLGWQIWSIPEAIMWHKIGQSANNDWTSYQWARSKIIFFRKWSTNWHKIFLLVYAFCYAAFRALVPKKGVGNRGPFISALRGLRDGLQFNLSNRK